MVTESADFNELVEKEPWLSTSKLVVKPDMLFGKPEFYLNVVSDRLGDSISFTECGGIEIEENWDKVKTVSVPTGVPLKSEIIAPLVATLPLETRGEIEEFLKVVFALFQESFIHGLDEKTSASSKLTVLNPACRIWTMVARGGASVIYADTVGDLGYASELGNYPEYSGTPKEEVLHQCQSCY
ncbi:hypothetical protein K1719_041915 [Acacia pycnantha]|nr:hypothetical protein K1719_041915 [Acacia pycnantha]